MKNRKDNRTGVVKDCVHRAMLFGVLLAAADMAFAQASAEVGVQKSAKVGTQISKDAMLQGDWQVMRVNAQRSFALTVPRGNYSGITHLHDDVYAVVSDKSDSALYFNFRIQVDPVTGELQRVENLGYVERVDGSRKGGNIVSDGSRKGGGIVSDGSEKKVGGNNGGEPWRGTETGFDHEAIAKVSDSTLVVASEGKCRLKEYPILPFMEGEASSSQLSSSLSGKQSLWQADWDSELFYPNYNFESLAYDSVRHYLWTIPECTMRMDGLPATPGNPVANKLRLIRYTWPQGKENVLDGEQAQNDGRVSEQSVEMEHIEYAYLMDKPSTTRKAETYVLGVSELCALPDGQLLVLEREAFIPKIKLGAFCKCKLYIVNPLEEKPIVLQRLSENAPFVKKRLLTEWRTHLSLIDFSFANYEGMCLGPTLQDGSQVLILLSDSQDQYAGILRDYFKTIVIAKQ